MKSITSIYLLGDKNKGKSVVLRKFLTKLLSIGIRLKKKMLFQKKLNVIMT